MWLRARIVLPVGSPAIEDGAVILAGKRICRVGRWSHLKSEVKGAGVDLGEVVLLPGLINAHCHLDYTDLAGKLPPRKSFTDWIKALVALKATWTNAEYTRSWQRGAEMLLGTGTTTVVDIESVPELVPAIWESTPLKVISMRELISIKRTVPELIRAVSREWGPLPKKRVGLSPHAPYTTSPALLHAASQAARRRHWPLTTHVAESEEEYTMFRHGSGSLFEWLQSQRDMSDCGQGSPVQHLEKCGYLQPGFIAVHANYLGRGDAQLLGRRQVSVVHCPGSHRYFRHRPFPLRTLTRAGVNVCLGTDSLASAIWSGPKPSLNLFTEMQIMAATFPGLSPRALLEMATLNAAKALGRPGQLGQLSCGAAADLIAVPFAGQRSKACDALVHCQGNIIASMINGSWAIAPAQSLQRA